jgi:hypothetical protein
MAVVLSDVAPCGLAETDRRFRGLLTRWSVSARLHGATQKKTTDFFIFVAVWTWNLNQKNGGRPYGGYEELCLN